MRASGKLLWAYAACFYSLLYLPILVLIVLSFNDAPAIGFPIQGLTTRWYADALAGGQVMQALGNSLSIGIASAALGTLLALATALGLRRSPRWRGVMLPLLLVPIITPGIVSGVLMLVFAGMIGLPYGLWTTAFPAHVTWVLPFAFLTLHPRIEQLDRALEEAAMDLGARPRQVLSHVVLPVLQPALIATVLFSFTVSFDEFVRTLFVIGGARTMPVQLWISLQQHAGPFIPAMGVVIMLISMLVAALGFFISHHASARSLQPQS